MNGDYSLYVVIELTLSLTHTLSVSLTLARSAIFLLFFLANHVYLIRNYGRSSLSRSGLDALC